MSINNNLNKQDDKEDTTKKIDLDLPKAVFEGTIIFLGISLGILNFALMGTVTLSNPFLFIFLEGFSIFFGLVALVLSFNSMRNLEEVDCRFGFYFLVLSIVCILFVYLSMINITLSMSIDFPKK